ncbi:MAG: aminoacyl-tRNA hydrolase [Dehalococcoidia bacterium]
MRLIVGLGNPGPEYARNRHNIGFLCVSDFARVHGLSFGRRLARSRVAQGEVEGIPLAVARPGTFMNLSGQAVALLMKRFKVSPEELIVVHDDLDLPLGRIRLRPGGSSGGHRGVESIIDSLGSRDFPRVRVGIGRPGEGERSGTIDWVLGDFTTAERDAVRGTVAWVGQALVCLLAEGVETAMNRFNSPAPELPKPISE